MHSKTNGVAPFPLAVTWAPPAGLSVKMDVLLQFIFATRWLLDRRGQRLTGQVFLSVEGFSMFSSESALNVFLLGLIKPHTAGQLSLL